MKTVSRVCIGGPLDGEIVEQDNRNESFTKDSLPSKEWPGNANGDSIRRDTYEEDGPHWIWVKS